ncbi:MAG: hypothetical protein K2O34_01820 [Acetatifactor sp.]|nr:hypothetical protein [Acetatifactor sp.]
MEQHYKYISENSLSYVYLHDCCCRLIHFEDSRLIFEMEWMEILAQHPLNPYPQAHQSGPGRIEFISPRIIDSALAETGVDTVRQLYAAEEFDFRDTEFLRYSEEKNGNLYQAVMYLIFYDNTAYNNLAIELTFEKSLIMWDELNDVSWFEDEIWSK